jgi:hypothetical protein
LNPLICDICKKTFDSLDKLGEHQKQEHDMWFDTAVVVMTTKENAIHI